MASCGGGRQRRALVRSLGLAALAQGIEAEAKGQAGGGHGAEIGQYVLRSPFEAQGGEAGLDPRRVRQPVAVEAVPPDEVRGQRAAGQEGADEQLAPEGAPPALRGEEGQEDQAQDPEEAIGARQDGQGAPETGGQAGQPAGG